MRALGYFLVDASSPLSSASREYQERAFLQYCQKHQHNPIRSFVESTNDPSRVEYQHMVAHIRESGQGYLLVLSDPGHLGADLEEGVRRLLELDTLHTQVVCTDEEIPDALQGMVHRWMASSPLAQRRERIREAMRAKAVRGEGLGKPPYGYRIGGDGKLEQVLDEVQVVHLIFDLYLAHNLGVRSIARYLNERGHITRRGQGWSMVTIRDILRNQVYIGTYIRFGLRVPSSHPGVVSTSDFRRVQDRMRGRSPARKYPRAQPFLLSGLVYCGDCGSRMMGVTRRQMWRRKDGERVRGHYRYYQCQSRTNRSQCAYHTWRAAELEEQVLSQVRLEVDGYDQDVIVVESAPQRESLEVERAQGRLSGLRRRFLAYVKRAAEGALSLQRLRALLAGVEAERARVLHRIAGLNMSPHDTASVSRELKRRFREEWERLSLLDRQEILHFLVQRITLHDRCVEVVLRRVRSSGGAPDGVGI